MRTFSILFFVCFLLSCEKREMPVPKHVKVEVVDTISRTAGELKTSQVDMGVDYRTQIWFSLGENRIASSNLKTTWDICFEASASGTHILLNSSRVMRIYKTAYSNLSEVTDTAGLAVKGKTDLPGGQLDSTAVGDWQADNKVYVVNRGYNELGQQTGYYKLKITGVTALQYTFEYGDVFGQQVFQGTVNKDAAYNFIGYSFTDHALALQVEPMKQDFDLCFTYYTHIFYNPFQYYQVSGVLTNSYKTRIAKITDKNFESIILRDTSGRTFVTKRDAIGYDWKTFDLNNNVYTVNPSICYIVNDSKGYYYKLHFIDFYNAAGMKGAPKFEFKRL